MEVSHAISGRVAIETSVVTDTICDGSPVSISNFSAKRAEIVALGQAADNDSAENLTAKLEFQSHSESLSQRETRVRGATEVVDQTLKACKSDNAHTNVFEQQHCQIDKGVEDRFQHFHK